MAIAVMFLVPAAAVFILIGTILLYLNLSKRHNQEKSKYGLPADSVVSSASVSEAVAAVNSSPILTRSPSRHVSPSRSMTSPGVSRPQSPISERQALSSGHSSPVRDYGSSPLRRTNSDVIVVKSPLSTSERNVDKGYIPEQEERCKQLERFVETRMARDADVSERVDSHVVDVEDEVPTSPEVTSSSESFSEKMAYSSSSGKENFFTPCSSFPQKFGSMSGRILGFDSVSNSRRASDAFSEKFFTPDQYPSYLGTSADGSRGLASSCKERSYLSSPRLKGIDEESSHKHTSPAQSSPMKKLSF